MTIPTRTIKTVYPCCEGPARLTALSQFPRETYDRVCPECATKYLVERRAINLPLQGVTVDLLDWTDKATRLYTNKYG